MSLADKLGLSEILSATHRYSAKPAKVSVATLAVSQTLDLRQHSCISDLWEAVAIRAGDAAEVHQNALDEAARDLGYADFDAAIRAVMNAWAMRLRLLPASLVKQDARANWRYVEICARLGWCTDSLWGRVSGLIPRLNGAQISLVHRDWVTLEDGTLLMRCPRDGDPPVWDTH